MPWHGGLVASLLWVACACGRVIEISTSGSVTTLQQATDQATAGDVVQYRAGTYYGPQVTSIRTPRGTPAQPIVIRAAPGEAVVIDGTGFTAANCPVLFQINNASWVKVEGPLEIRNAPADGMSINGYDLDVHGVHVHHTMNWAVTIAGDDVHFSGNDIDHCVMSNENATLEASNWPQCLAVWGTSSYTNGRLCQRVWIERNTFDESWGETLDVTTCDGCGIRGNVIKAGYSVMLYSDNSINSLFEGNVVWLKSDRFNRNNKQWRPSGIAIGLETWVNPPVPGVNLTFRNNLVVGAGTGIQSIYMTSYVSQVRILHNTFFGVTQPMWLYPCPQTGTRDNQLIGNVFHMKSRFDYASIAAEDISTWQIGHNVWLGDIPDANKTVQDSSTLVDTSLVLNVASGFSNYFNPACDVDALAAGFSEVVDPRCFSPQASSPLVGRGMDVGVKRDFFSCLRDPLKPVAGFSLRRDATCENERNSSSSSAIRTSSSDKSSKLSSAASVPLVFPLIAFCASLCYY